MNDLTVLSAILEILLAWLVVGSVIGAACLIGLVRRRREDRG